MGKTIKVTPELLEQAAGKIESLAGDYKAQYEALYGETGALASTWQGADNLAFTDRIEGFKPDLARMQEHMLEYAQFLRKAAEGYRNTQGGVISHAKGLTN